MAQLALVAISATACAKPVGTGSRPSGNEVVIFNRIPIQCTQVRKEQRELQVEVLPPTGCNATVRFRLMPSGYQDVEIPFFRDAVDAESREPLSDGRVVEQSIVLRDPPGERRWAVEIPGASMPWAESGPCARPADRSQFDMNAWRFLVVRVLTRDALGTARPVVETQSDTLELSVIPGGSRPPFQPAIVPSATHDGVWAAAWCATASEGAYDLRLNVHGAYQLQTDPLRMPNPDRDSYTFLDYTIEPQATAQGH